MDRAASARRTRHLRWYLAFSSLHLSIRNLLISATTGARERTPNVMRVSRRWSLGLESAEFAFPSYGRACTSASATATTPNRFRSSSAADVAATYTAIPAISALPVRGRKIRRGARIA
jgi:hypothetical protein